MNKIKMLTAVLAITMMFSCESFLEDPQPSQSLPSSTAFTKGSDVLTGLIGAYNYLQDSDVGGTNFTMIPDIMTENGDWRGSFTSYQDISQFKMTADNGEIENMWRDGYRSINAANLVIEASQSVEDAGFTVAQRNQYRGEGLFIRAAIHFEMVRFYGKPYGSTSSSDPGISLMVAAVEDVTDITFPERSSVEAVYSQCEIDLQEAVTLLEGFSERGRASSNAAKCYLAEIAFMKRDYPTAATLASEVIGSGDYELTAEPADFFVNEGSSEEIFTVVHTTQDNPGVNGSLPTFHNEDGRGGDVVYSQDLLENGFGKVITADQQTAIDGAGGTVRDMRLVQLSDTTAGITFIEKYEDPVTNADDAPIWRLAELMLMRAEARARTEGINMGSVNLLNRVRTRSLRVVDGDGNLLANSDELVSFQESDFADANELIEAIILERRVELCFEGNHFHDLMRLGRSAKGLAPDADKLRFPIPQTALDANSGLMQNPGY
ncbi:MAG: RagB/SusD family nutrient uptake outer membrane protein [Bacteroidota bacterium]